MNSRQDPNADKHGQALSAQRFQMIKDIADELGKGDVVFPTSFDAALRLRRELQNPDLPLARISSIVSLEPLSLCLQRLTPLLLRLRFGIGPEDHTEAFY